jgi:flagellar basal-body rod modification protein FlgD
MQIGTVDSTTSSVTSSSSSSSSLLPTQTLNQQDFLNLLVTELQNQDPMNPMSDTDFIAQMAQFSTLQQAQQTYQSISETQATNLIGATVTVSGTGGVTATGTVTSVLMNSGTPEIVVNGQPYTLDEVQGVTPASTAASTSPTTSANTPGSSTTPTP